jgi:hypothetical protein
MGWGEGRTRRERERAAAAEQKWEKRKGRWDVEEGEGYQR